MFHQLPHDINKTPLAVNREGENYLVVAPDLLYSVAEPKQMQASFRLQPTLSVYVVPGNLPLPQV